MRINFRAPFVAIAMAVGLIVLVGYFFDNTLLGTLRRVFLQWALILVAVALLVGLVNLAAVHYRRVASHERGSPYSLVLLVSLAIALLISGIFGPTSTWGQWMYSYIQVPIESSLLAILAVILAYASARMLGRRLNAFSLVFIGTVLVVLVGMATLPGIQIPFLSELRIWISQVPASAGARGILLGVALGTVATGLRVLMGADRPYGG